MRSTPSRALLGAALAGLLAGAAAALPLALALILGPAAAPGLRPELCGCAGLALSAAALAGLAALRAARRGAEAARAQRELDLERRRLEAVLGILPGGVLFADGAGRLVRASREARRIWGGGEPRRAPARYGACRVHRAGDGAPLGPREWGVGRILHTGRPCPRERIRIDRFDGTPAEVLWSGAPITGGGGELLGAVALLEDAPPAIAPARPAAEPPLELLTEAADRLRAQGLAPCLAAEPGLPAVACDRGAAIGWLVALAGTLAPAAGGALSLAAEARGGAVVFRLREAPGSAPGEGAAGVDDALELARARRQLEAQGAGLWVEGARGQGRVVSVALPTAGIRAGGACRA